MATTDSDTGWALAWRALRDLYPKGLSLFWLAPAVVALVIVPEFLQHAAEIRLGMFLGKEQALAVADSPQRMAFGYLKLAGLALAFLAAARFWWTRQHGGRWWDVRQVSSGRFLLGLFLFFGLGSVPELFKNDLPERAYHALAWAVAILLLPALFLMLGGLFGDRSPSLRSLALKAWPWLLLTAILVVVAFVSAQWLHQMNHRWAMGADELFVWALMIFDSLLVGLLAGLAGTALYLGYAAFAARCREKPAD